jgi:hypothetical protein
MMFKATRSLLNFMLHVVTDPLRKSYVEINTFVPSIHVLIATFVHLHFLEFWVQIPKQRLYFECLEVFHCSVLGCFVH